jgi:hypothetical protein
MKTVYSLQEKLNRIYIKYPELNSVFCTSDNEVFRTREEAEDYLDDVKLHLLPEQEDNFDFGIYEMDRIKINIKDVIKQIDIRNRLINSRKGANHIILSSKDEDTLGSIIPLDLNTVIEIGEDDGLYVITGSIEHPSVFPAFDILFL